MRYFLLASLLLLSACSTFQLPELEDYAPYAFKAPDTPAGAPVLEATFLGTTTIYFNDGETGILIDGFFTRPGNLGQLLFGQIATDKTLVKDYLQRLQIKKLAAIPVFHSHYDHAMDSAEIARLTGAQLLGSPSTVQIGRGADLPESQLVAIEPGKAYQYGKFTIRMEPSHHVALPGVAQLTGMMGDIDKPLKQPAWMFSYAEGETYAIIIEHPLGNSMLHSGSFKPGELARGYQIHTLFQCTPGLNKLSPADQEQYYQEIIANTGVKRVIPVHWDDFTHSLDQPLVPLPKGAEDLDLAMDYLIERSQQQPFQIQFMPVWQRLPLFVGDAPLNL